MHRYPLYYGKDFVQDAYFGLFVYGNSQEHIEDVFHSQLLKRNSALQDYLIAGWMKENNERADLSILKSNYLFYQKIDTDSLYSDSNKDYMIMYYFLLGAQIQDLEAVCE